MTEALKQTLPEGYEVHDSEGLVIYRSDSAAMLLGLMQDQLLDPTLLDSRWEAQLLDGTPLPGERHPAMVALRERHVVRDPVFAVQAIGIDPSNEDEGTADSLSRLLEWTEAQAKPRR